MENGYSHEIQTTPGRIPEARYAYYRRCQQFRKNGQQCKAPAVKGEPIYHKHAEQAAMKERWARQRRELLATPGLGFGDFRAVQRTLSAVAQALLDGPIDEKTAGRLLIELQTASKLLWLQHLLNRRGHKGTAQMKDTPKKEERQSPAVKANPRASREWRCSAVAGQMRPRSVRTRECRAQGEIVLRRVCPRASRASRGKSTQISGDP